MTYLERYLAGEHEQVWTDLVALGEKVHEPSLLPDAWAVAVETMRRVRYNIERLIPRLTALGYVFGYDWLDARERQFAVGQPPVFTSPSPNHEELIAQIEQFAGPIPLSLRAFYSVVGAVNFVGTPPPEWSIAEEADPLYVCQIEDVLVEFRDWSDAHRAWITNPRPGGNPGPLRIPIAPDYLHKYNISGGMWYNVPMPNPGADALLDAERHTTTFVNYLRICFCWGGLPGLDQANSLPHEALASLREGLLPL